MKCKVCNTETKVNKKVCQRCAVKAKRLRNKIAGVFHLGGKCQRCGFRCSSIEDVAGFDFHHRDPSQKSFQISGNLDRKSWIDLKAEIEKCDLLCSRCHNIEHFKLGKEEKFLDYALSANSSIKIERFGRLPPRKLEMNKCRVCAKETFNKYCSIKCASFAKRKVERPTKEQLLTDIQKMSLVKIGEKYRVSDNAIRKWIKNLLR